MNSTLTSLAQLSTTAKIGLGVAGLAVTALGAVAIGRGCRRAAGGAPVAGGAAPVAGGAAPAAGGAPVAGGAAPVAGGAPVAGNRGLFDRYIGYATLTGVTYAAYMHSELIKNMLGEYTSSALSFATEVMKDSVYTVDLLDTAHALSETTVNTIANAGLFFTGLLALYATYKAGKHLVSPMAYFLLHIGDKLAQLPTSALGVAYSHKGKLALLAITMYAANAGLHAAGYDAATIAVDAYYKARTCS